VGHTTNDITQFRSLPDRLDLAATLVTADALHSPCQHADWLITSKHAGMRSPTAMRRRHREAAAVKSDSGRAFPQVKAGMVGLAGLEPAASS
jgi:hypothetical protein